MTEICLWLTRLTAACCLCALMVCLPAGPVPAQEEPPVTVEEEALDGNCAEAVVLLKEQQKKLSRELRRIQRELAALREELAAPGLREVFSGIGYTLGLFGVAFFVQGRKQVRKE